MIVVPASSKCYPGYSVEMRISFSQLIDLGQGKWAKPLKIVNIKDTKTSLAGLIVDLSYNEFIDIKI